MKIFTAENIRKIDAQTMELEPIASSDLMERAAMRIALWVLERYDRSSILTVISGPGNNGGDGLAMSRILTEKGYTVNTFFAALGAIPSRETKENLERLKALPASRVNSIEKESDFPEIDDSSVIIDALFGTGLSRPLESIAAKLVNRINDSGAEIISVDIPSGLFSEDNSTNSGAVVKADVTLTLQFPKISFMFSENYQYTGRIEIIPIGLHPVAIGNVSSPFRYIESEDVKRILKIRSKFDHKGIYGHLLVAAGSPGKMGAAVLAAKAALRGGAGLVTCHVPCCGNEIIQCSLPEAMTRMDQSDIMITDITDPGSFDAVAAGPGMGVRTNSQKAVRKLLEEFEGNLVLDADALNILSLNPEWFNFLRENTVLTPHPGEFERMTGKAANSYERMQKQIEFSKKYRVIIVLKGACTSVSFPDGEVWFNSTGNPGMATAGSGDVLTGLIGSLMAQGVDPSNAAVAGVYLHGLAGDIALEKCGEESLIASDITGNIGNAYLKVRRG